MLPTILTAHQEQDTRNIPHIVSACILLQVASNTRPKVWKTADLLLMVLHCRARINVSCVCACYYVNGTYATAQPEISPVDVGARTCALVAGQAGVKDHSLIRGCHPVPFWVFVHRPVHVASVFPKVDFQKITREHQRRLRPQRLEGRSAPWLAANLYINVLTPVATGGMLCQLGEQP